MQPDRQARREYVAAFREIAARIASSLTAAPSRLLPVGMYVAGGAALYFHTGARISLDIDASFSRRIALPQNLEVGYDDADGASRLLYFDRQYSDALALMHDGARDDSQPLELDGIDRKILDVRLLSPLDLAVSKLGRFSTQDRDDITALAQRKLIGSAALRRRAEEAVVAYVGDTDRVRGAIDIACRIVDGVQARARKPRKS